MRQKDLMNCFIEKYFLSEIDPGFVLDGINSCLDDFVCDDWLEVYLNDLRKGLRFHALKMPIKGPETETFEYLARTNAVKVINLYCCDDRNQIFLIPETDKKFPSFSLKDSELWYCWAVKNQEKLRRKYRKET